MSVELSAQQAKREEDEFHFTASYMTANQQIALTLFAWSLVGAKHATGGDVTMTNIDRVGFTLSIHGKAYTYKFKQPLLRASDARVVLTNLNESCSVVSWPGGIAPWATLLLWIVALLAGSHENTYRENEVFQLCRSTSLVIFRKSDYAAYTLFALIIAHTFEALYSAYILSMQVRMKKAAVNTWLSAVMILGYPLTSKAMQLAALARKFNKNKPE